MKYLKPFGVALLCFAFLVPSAEAAQPSSLQGYWKLDEASGTSVADASGNGNNGTMINGPVPSADVPGVMNNHFPDPYSLTFDGTDDSVGFGAVNSMGTSDFTLAVWFKTSDTDAVTQVLIGKNGPGYLMALDAEGKLRFNLTDNVTFVNGSKGSDYRDGTWHHAAITFDRSGDATYYIDGVAIGTTDISTQSGSLNDSGSSLVLGQSGNNMFFNGSMDDVRIYTRVLSAGEVTLLASGENTAAVTSVTAPANGTYAVDDVLDFIVTYNETVTVDTAGGTPRIVLTLSSGGPAYANYVSGSGSTEITFRYIVGTGQNASSGLVLASSVDANGGALTASGDDADLTLNNVDNTTDVLVDTTEPPSPSSTPQNRVSSRTHYGCKDTAALNYERFAASRPELCRYAAASVSTATVPASTLTVRDLEVGIVGNDVLLLQKFLNANSFILAESGPGSLGNETMLFGTLTRAALSRFQATHGIAPAAGYFGPITRGQIKNMNLSSVWW
ncbi:MAG: LamG-like jellyroll fold domain-containing protein [bacterium]|nr:LamG-like jellyroll fold domain-containing protein [bacterium]